MFKRTKIVATIGPASSSKEKLIELANAGMNVARVNFSHGDHETHQKVIDTIREINQEEGLHISLLGDLQGPKLRIGDIDGDEMVIEDGQELVLCTEPGVKDTVEVRYETFAKDVKPGQAVLIDDGNLKLEVVKTDGKKKATLKVLHGGVLKSRKGINLPSTKIDQPSLTAKDRKDLEFAIAQNFDWIALSFVRSPRDIIELKHIIRSHEVSSRVIAKIEKPEAITNMEAIIAESDGVMVARGDLGVEIPMAEVPLAQKTIIDRCRSYGKPVIVATQMMESMITNIQPTRAEVNDVANAVLDGSDAVMLSAETSVGRFPVQTVQAMTNIIQRMEDHGPIYFRSTKSAIQQPERMISDAICETSTKLSKKAEAEGIVTMTHSGYTALKISSYRPKAKIFVFTSNRSLLTQMSLVWGVKAFFYDKMVSTDHTIADIKYLLKQEGLVEEGALLINIASMPISEQGMTNMMKLSRVR